MKATINATGTEIAVLSRGDENDFISLTDIARYKNPDEPKDVVKNWMRNRSAIEFLGLWGQLNNPDSKGVEFDSFAIKNNLIPQRVSRQQQAFTYASEADMLNVALFGKTARGRKEQTPEAKVNMRDEATIQQLIVLSNLESMNAELIKQGIPQNHRLVALNKIAIDQMTSILGSAAIRRLEENHCPENI
jgi:hypothetical protein